MVTSLATCLACILPLAATEVQLRTLDGRQLRGEVLQLNATELTLKSAGQKQTLPLSSLHTLGVQETTATVRWKMQVTLTDGSVLHCVDYSAAGDAAKLTFADLTQQTIPLKHIRAVLLRNAGGDLYRAWREYLREASSTDRLVVRRTANTKSETNVRATFSLDVMEGVLGDVATDGVRFELDGEPIKVKREKAEGLLYFRRNTQLANEACCYLVDREGSRWAVKTLSTTPDEIRIETPTAQQLTLPWSCVRLIDFFSANAVYLSADLLDGKRRGGFFESKATSATNSFGPLFDRTPEGVIHCGGKEIAHGVWMPAQSSLTFNVPPKCKQLTLQAGFDDHLGETDGVELVIEADGKTLFSQIIRRQSQPQPLALPLQQAKRVRISVNHAGDSQLGDTLVLSEAMFTQ
jgi:hypothetical protein